MRSKFPASESEFSERESAPSKNFRDLSAAISRRQFFLRLAVINFYFGRMNFCSGRSMPASSKASLTCLMTR